MHQENDKLSKLNERCPADVPQLSHRFRADFPEPQTTPNCKLQFSGLFSPYVLCHFHINQMKQYKSNYLFLFSHKSKEIKTNVVPQHHLAIPQWIFAMLKFFNQQHMKSFGGADKALHGDAHDRSDKLEPPEQIDGHRQKVAINLRHVNRWDF